MRDNMCEIWTIDKTGEEFYRCTYTSKTTPPCQYFEGDDDKAFGCIHLHISMILSVLVVESLCKNRDAIVDAKMRSL